MSQEAKAKAKWVCYYRVSTTKQGESGLGLDAQKEAVARFLDHQEGEVIGHFTETESGKKAHNRPQLQEALDLCRRQRATLVIAKLDRLGRNVHFISGLMETRVDFIALDSPDKNPFMLHLQAAFAEEEARRISERTRAALAAAKARGVAIGATGKILAERHKAEAMERARELAPIIQEIRSEGILTVRGIRDELNLRGIPGPGGGRWYLPSTHRMLTRLSGASLILDVSSVVFEHGKSLVQTMQKKK